MPSRIPLPADQQKPYVSTDYGVLRPDGSVEAHCDLDRCRHYIKSFNDGSRLVVRTVQFSGWSDVDDVGKQ